MGSKFSKFIPKDKITHFVMMGDSLSDRGTLNQRRLLGFIPMGWLSGLQGTSPKGRFTNGYTWADHLSASIANEFNIRWMEKRKRLDSTDIADDVIAQDPHVETSVQNNYFLNNDRFVQFRGRDFVRNYDEGGLTAHDYSWRPSNSVTRFFTRLIVSTLSAMRNKLLAYDREHELSKRHKAQTLIVEWSGANDLLTVNEKPSQEEVDKAVKARIDNVKKLIANGYRHFVLFNLPDLTLTPRYQNKSPEERELAAKCTRDFNIALAAACADLAKSYPHCVVDVFDVNAVFKDVYDHPQQNGFDPAKRKLSYIQSPDFVVRKNQTSHAPGYMFWDDIHPTSAMHEKLAQAFYARYRDKYDFSTPPPVEALQEERVNLTESQLRQSFVKLYQAKFKQDKLGLFGYWRNSKIAAVSANLDTILRHALYEDGGRTREVITQLQWIDEAGNLNLNVPLLKQAMARVENQYAIANKNLQA